MLWPSGPGDSLRSFVVVVPSFLREDIIKTYYVRECQAGTEDGWSTLTKSYLEADRRQSALLHSSLPCMHGWNHVFVCLGCGSVLMMSSGRLRGTNRTVSRFKKEYTWQVGFMVICV